MQPKSLFGSRQQIYSNQSSANKKLSTGSVKTPSLLFYRPNVSSAQKCKKSLSVPECENSYGMNYNGHNKMQRQGSVAVLEYYCENHNKILAKYYSRTQEEDQQIYYCQKCAQLLMNQGFEVLSLYQNNMCKVATDSKNNFQRVQCYPYPERQHQIDSFLANLNGAKEQITQSSAQIRDILINSQQFYGQQIQEINEYFQTIMQSLELQKNKCYNHILVQRQNAQKDVREMINKLVQGQKELNSMTSDIQQNLDSVYSISWQNYKLVMDAFKSRMSEIDRLLNDIKQKGIMDVEYRKIQFAGVPQSINSLSEIIIQNSYGSIQGSDGTLLLTDNDNRSSFNARNKQIPDNSIFDKLRTDHSCDSAANQENGSHMMFSFDGEKMKSCRKSQDNYGDQNNPINVRNSVQKDEQPIKLLKNKNFMHSAFFENKKLETVMGIKEVQQVDVLQIDQDTLNAPIPNLRMGRC